MFRGSRLKILLPFTLYLYLSTFSGCGYHIVGSRHLPFSSVTIKPVQNKTYEPKLEERLHNALAEAFLSQGIKVTTANGDIAIETTITTFKLGAIAYIDERVQEQTIIMRVDTKVIDKERVFEFPSMESPIKITFQTSGTISDSVIQKERAIDKACNEIAGELVGKIILRYAEQ